MEDVALNKQCSGIIVPLLVMSVCLFLAAPGSEVWWVVLKGMFSVDTSSERWNSQAKRITPVAQVPCVFIPHTGAMFTS